MQDPFVLQVEKEFDAILKNLESAPVTGKMIMNQLTQRYIEEKCLASGKPFPTFLKPAFISPAQMEMVKNVTNIIMKCLEKVSNLYFEDRQFHPYFEMAPGEDEIASVRMKYPNKVQHARLDAFMEGDSLQFCEFNCDTPGGPGYSDIQVDLILQTEPLIQLQKKYQIVRDTFMQNVLDSLLACYRFHGWDGKGYPRILIHTIFDLDPTRDELYVLQKYFESKGYETLVAEPDACKLHNGKLMVADKPVELVYRRGATQWWITHKEKFEALWNAYKNGLICMANPLNSKLAGKKSLMAVLQSDFMQSKLTDIEKEVVARHVPWTRLVENTTTGYNGKTVNLLEFLTNNREIMVLKPIGLYGGKNVAIGRDLSQKDWVESLSTAVKERYVAQEYIPIPVINLPVFSDNGLVFEPKKINMNFFAFNGSYAGGMARVSDSSIINISAGGGLIPIMLVQNPDV